MPIFDQGYQQWRGPLSGHAWRWLTIARHGVRVQMKNRILRGFVLLAWLPALALVVAVALWGLVEQQSEGVLPLVRGFLPPDVLQEPRAFRPAIWTLAYSFFFKFEMFFIMLLAAVAGPGLISRDLRFNALPLYFARPLTRLDYFLGKLGVIGALVAGVAVGPAVFAYVVGVCFCLDLSVVKDTYPVLLAAVAYGLVITLSVGTLLLALSSLTRRSLYVIIAWAGLWIISGSVGSILTGIHGETVRRGVREAEMARWVQEHPPPPGVQMYRYGPAARWQPGSRKLQPIVARPEQQAEADRWYDAWSQASGEAWVKAQAEQAEASRRDWRPLCSYTANLNRIADLLLDTDAAWVTIGRAVERPRAAFETAFGMHGGPRGPRGPRAGQAPVYERRLADMWVPQYPWGWSAGVLAGLVGVSTWTLTRRVKSLDRLR
jgi:ABC-type transport system involved in multi-copper enzyme maturation permease subunit